MTVPTRRLLILLGASLLVAHPADAADADADRFVVRRGSAEIRMGDVDARLARVPPEDRAIVMDSPQRIEQILLSLLAQRQMADKARELGLDQDDAFERELRLFAEEILSRRYLEHVQRTSTPPRFELTAREMYLADPSVGMVPESREVSHILIRVEGRGDAAARAEIEAIRAELLEHPDRFEEIARARSEDPSAAANGGRLGHLREEFDADFVAGAQALTEPGEISAPVRTTFGYHLIRLDSLRPAERRSFEDIRAGLIMQLEQRYLRDIRLRELERVGAEPLEADPEAVASLRDRYRARTD
jgi:parvulin-like peptidyl-prolyl isomerase